MLVKRSLVGVSTTCPMTRTADLDAIGSDKHAVKGILSMFLLLVDQISKREEKIIVCQFPVLADDIQ